MNQEFHEKQMEVKGQQKYSYHIEKMLSHLDDATKSSNNEFTTRDLHKLKYIVLKIRSRISDPIPDWRQILELFYDSQVDHLLRTTVGQCSAAAHTEFLKEFNKVHEELLRNI